jgi:hypothetical protein
VTDAGFVAHGSQPGGAYSAEFQGRIVLLRRGHGLDLLRLRVTIDYTIDAAVERRGWWQANLAGWVYELSSAAGEPMLDFHWHPSLDFRRYAVARRASVQGAAGISATGEGRGGSEKARCQDS